jgi:hypothetical protein
MLPVPRFEVDSLRRIKGGGRDEIIGYGLYRSPRGGLPEMEALIRKWLGSRYPATCPHGRSICYRLDHRDIARKRDRH